MRVTRIFGLSLLFALLCGVTPVLAAETPAAAPVAGVATAHIAAPAAPEDMNKPFKGSLLFTPSEVSAIEQAMHPGAAGTAAGAKVKLRHSVIRLSGVFWRAPQDWIIWVNGQKVTPDSLLPQIRGIEVDASSEVHFKWYDAAYNKVISITLHPHETYDVGTGILLPEAD